jgi:hypothetical protein
MILQNSCRAFQLENIGMYSLVAAVTLILLSSSVTATETSQQSVNTQRSNDTHYTKAGFFDIHVCNWPDRELFFMPLFSTIHYSEITDIKIQRPDGKMLTSLNLKKFNLLKQKDKPEKHVFMSQMDVPKNAVDGWYSATISLANGTQVIAKDYVIISRMPRASDMNPPDGAEEIPIPKKLTWSGAEKSFYQVFIRDVWNDSKLIYRSKLLNKPELTIPPGLLKPDGLYSWKIHARDVNEDVLLGDFNKGSLSHSATFSTSSD